MIKYLIFILLLLLSSCQREEGQICYECITTEVKFHYPDCGGEVEEKRVEEIFCDVSEKMIILYEQKNTEYIEEKCFYLIKVCNCTKILIKDRNYGYISKCKFTSN